MASVTRTFSFSTEVLNQISGGRVKAGRYLKVICRPGWQCLSIAANRWLLRKSFSRSTLNVKLSRNTGARYADRLGSVCRPDFGDLSEKSNLFERIYR